MSPASTAYLIMVILAFSAFAIVLSTTWVVTNWSQWFSGRSKPAATPEPVPAPTPPEPRKAA